MEEEKLGKLDILLQKLTSRKLLVWLTATILMGFTKIDSEHWIWISAIYIGGETVIDAIQRFRSGK